MAHKIYDNFYLSNEVEDQFNSHLNLQQFCTVDSTLVGTAGMTRKINKYTATNGTEKLAIVCTHIDKHHIHNHIIWNSTSLDHTRKFRDFLGSGRAVRRLSDTICIENGYSIVTNPKGRGKSYDKWLGGKPFCHREQLRMAIDAALARKPADLDALLELLKAAGILQKAQGQT